jgi:uncharacterized membrane protein YphA (DoxX/SURF4 family)
MNIAGKAMYYWDRLFYYLSFLVPTATRAVVGLAFYTTGKGKLEHLPDIIEYFRSLGIPHPEIQAPLVAHLEYYGGIALMAGLFTRFFGAGLAITMIVALLTADKSDIINAFHNQLNLPVPEDYNTDRVPTEVTAFTNLALLGWLVFYGPGVLSVDYWAGRWIRRKLGILPDSASETVDLKVPERISA